jgi:hypothetical protein
MSIDEFARTTPVRLPIVNRNTNPSVHKQAALYVIRIQYTVASHLKILIPVGTIVTVIVDAKYARVSRSIPTVSMWCVHITNPNSPITTAKIIPRFPNSSFFPLSWQMMCEIIPNPGSYVGSVLADSQHN